MKFWFRYYDISFFFLLENIKRHTGDDIKHNSKRKLTYLPPSVIGRAREISAMKDEAWNFQWVYGQNS